MDNSSDNSINTLSIGLGTIANDSYSYINNLLSNPTVIIILMIMLVLYITLILSLGDNNTQSISDEPVSNSGSKTIIIIFLTFFIILLIINVFQYFFGVDIIHQLKNLFTENSQDNITIDTSIAEAAKNDVPQLLLTPQVFNIPENKFVYSDAKALCSAYGARLATYKEIEEAYKNGAEWCNYGWSDGQMALFPTQQKTFDNLQKIEGHENDCGRPGINGGFIANPDVMFGVNCYGFRPKIRETERDLMAKEPIYPKTLKDKAMENRVNYWKDRLSEILVSPFNHNSWSKL
jgi:hypothetical protein